MLHKETDEIITEMTVKESAHAAQSARGDTLNYRIVLYIKIELIAKQTSRHHSFQHEQYLAPS